MKLQNKLNSYTRCRDARSYSEKPQEEMSLYMDDRSDMTDKKTELVANMIRKASKSA